MPQRLEDLPGVTRTDGVLVVERTLSDFTTSEAQSELVSGLRRARRGIDARGDIDELVRALIREPEGALFVDTETTGLGGNMVFMVGMMRYRGDDLRLTQVFARDYREERELLSAWAEIIGEAAMLVSFNGKSFDLPVLRDRMGLHGIRIPDEPGHLDLLHHARRRWSEALPDCRLQTLEWRICGRRRSGDIPGEEIPGVYHGFVRTGDPGDILTVFHHNALDLITLADIAMALTAPEDGPA
ncbi:MAG: ribonuclease H-like domain-containing protein [Candidatus Eisenbacteria bacterium]|nr:ribonuclease H-like domain-containing protein [Candidatus Eisenbacteria bacterium]